MLAQAPEGPSVGKPGPIPMRHKRGGGPSSPPPPFSLQWLGDPRTADGRVGGCGIYTDHWRVPPQSTDSPKVKSELLHDTLFNLTSVSEETCVKKCLSIFHSSKSTQALANPTV